MAGEQNTFRGDLSGLLREPTQEGQTPVETVPSEQGAVSALPENLDLGQVAAAISQQLSGITGNIGPAQTTNGPGYGGSNVTSRPVGEPGIDFPIEVNRR